MQPFPKNIDRNIDSLQAALLQVSRIREEDIIDRNTFDSIFMRGRKVGKIPTSVSDVAATDRVGDFNYDDTYFYLLVPVGASVEWRTLPFTKFSKVTYGSMGADDISVTVTVSSAGVYYKINSGFTAGLVDGFTFQNNRELKCLYAGKYKIDYGLTVRCASALQEVGAAPIINTTEVHLAESMAEIVSANRDVCLSGTCIVSLAVDDLVGLCVENETSATNVVVTHANLSVLRVGD